MTSDVVGTCGPGDACENTDQHLWPIVSDRGDADSIHVTKDGGIGINVGGHVIVMPLRKWFCAALVCGEGSVPDELSRLRKEVGVLREALEKISLMSKEHEHDLFSATQVARAALSQVQKEPANG
jgi:hypothetical protein